MEILTTPSSVTVPPDNSVIQAAKAYLDRCGMADTVHLMQYDQTLPVIAVDLWYNGQPYTVPKGAAVNIRVRKPDWTYVYNPVLGLSQDRRTVYIAVSAQMTAAFGEASAVVEIVLNGGVVGTGPIRFQIDKNPVPEETMESSGEFKTVIHCAEEAKESAAAAKLAEKDAADSAQSAQNSAETAAEKAEEARSVATKPPVIRGGNWWIWSAETGDYTDSGIDASVSLKIGTVNTGAPGTAASVKNSGTESDLILDFTIPQGQPGNIDGLDDALDQLNSKLNDIHNILAAEPVYGFIEHNAVLAPDERIEYIGINKNYKPVTVTMGGGYSLNDWADFPWLKANKPYMVRSDGTPDYRLDENDYTRKEDGTLSDVANISYDGGAFSWAMKIYKREYMVGDDRYVLFRFNKADGYEPVGFIDPDGNELEGAWIPMFYGSIVGDKMTSLSGLQPEYGHTTAEQKTAIDAVGNRAFFFGGSLVNTLIDLMIMFAKTTQLQGAYGDGNCNGYNSSLEPTMGVLENSVVGGGQFYGTTDRKSLNKVFHSIILTGGNAYCRDPYTLVVNGRFKVSPNYKYSLNGEGYLDTGVNVQVPNVNGWSYPHKYRTTPGFGHLPVSLYNGSSILGGCDGLYLAADQFSKTTVALRFGRCNDVSNAGPRCINANGMSTRADYSCGSALLLLPPVGVTV